MLMRRDLVRDLDRLTYRNRAEFPAAGRPSRPRGSTTRPTGVP